MIRIAIVGYGNVGKGTECAIKQNPDTELVGVFTRRDPATVTTLTGTPVYRMEDLPSFKGKIDCVILCSGSATDLPRLTPAIAKDFCVVDSFDTHHKIPAHFAAVDAAAREGGTLALISGGWDPGLFSLNRLYASAVLPDGADYTFWGRGVSQGHSDAIRRIDGVLDARQYTVPVPEALEAVRSGSQPQLTVRQKHTRECYVVAAPGADRAEIVRKIVTMPDYFDEYDTTVTFITQEEMRLYHSEMPHGGFVIRTGKTGLNGEHTQSVEYSLKLESNPEFTASALVALARAVVRMRARGETGAVTVFDIAPRDLSPLTPEQQRARLL